MKPTMLLHLLLLFTAVKADNPYDWSPSVSFTDNLDEPNDFGFCIDIQGFNATINCAGTLQAHSCKEAGDDTQFEFKNNALRAVTFNANCDAAVREGGDDRVCVQVVGDIVEGATLTLRECDGSPEQRFEFIDGELRIGSGGMCIVASTVLRQAGRFVARALFLSSCEETAAEFKVFTITPTPLSSTGEGGPACFPGIARVRHREKGWIPMKELSIGDHVLVNSKGKYEPTYSFGHHKTDSEAEFLHIETVESHELRISDRHMVSVQKQSDISTTIPANDIKVGDRLLSSYGYWSTVRNIERIKRVGLFAPFTPSGTIVVDDVVVSTYVAISTSELFPNQWVAHSFELPHRIWCYYLGQCLQEAYTEAGISTWVAGPHAFSQWLFKQPSVTIIIAATTALIPVLVSYAAIEWVLLHGWWGVLCVAAFAAVFTSFRLRQRRKVRWYEEHLQVGVSTEAILGGVCDSDITGKDEISRLSTGVRVNTT